MNNALSRRTFLAAGAAIPLADAACRAAEGAAAAEVIGPLVGHTDTTSTILWARFAKPGRHVLKLRTADGKETVREITAEAKAENDNTIHWFISGLETGTRYLAETAGGRPCSFTTAPAPEAPAKVKLAFGSCAREDEGSRAVWTRMLAENPDVVVLGGDTPYIDSTDIAKQRSRHRAFASVPEYQSLLSTRPFWSTWDDHDFGKNDADGTLKGKENSRQVFTEYRAQTEFGDGKEGIYTSFRWGPVEMFLIDARWWSYTGPSFADPTQKTLLGKGQWEWLTAQLRASTAPFKLLMNGVIWEDKQNKEKDDWETYNAERAALFTFIKEQRISGVMLIGGDIHVTRLLRYPPKFAGYPLWDFISSPIHDKVIPALNVPHPFLLESKEQPNTFLELTADSTVQPPTLTARFLDTEGKSLFADTVVSLSDVTPKGTRGE
ncbi:alkaline phosphatase D family protein [Anatilimnocola floriformis]|uniref:alkaline phosphatase D family protein n=1 Tax=Anatilimnocola floriformis TaxID=2948575 RepID=UPI0020C3FD7B|nr:alkaline phosphatase D family protein [Anatilimnocola floriformis]